MYASDVFFFTRPNFIDYLHSYMNKRSICGITAGFLLNEGQTLDFIMYVFNLRLIILNMIYVLSLSTTEIKGVELCRCSCSDYAINDS